MERTNKSALWVTGQRQKMRASTLVSSHVGAIRANCPMAAEFTKVFSDEQIRQLELAEEVFDLQELEEFAAQWRKENGYD